MRWFVLLLPLILSLPWILDLMTRVKHREHVREQAVVLLTGAGRGVGLGMTLQLASQGVLVLAGVRSAADLKSFPENPNIKPLLLDVSNPEHHKSALSEVAAVLSSSKRSFVGLMLNAGTLNRGPIELETEEQTRRVFEVNYFGNVQLIRKFLPLLREHQSRVVLVGSSAQGLPMPFLASYVATKAALLSFANVLRVEVESQGVAVTYVSLGSVKTDLLAEASTGSFNGTVYQKLATDMDAVFASAESMMATVEQVAPEMSNLLFVPFPPCTAYVGMDSKLAPIIALMPQRVIQSLATKPPF